MRGILLASTLAVLGVACGGCAPDPAAHLAHEAFRTPWDKPVQEFVVNGNWDLTTMPMTNGAWRGTPGDRTIPRDSGLI